MAKPTRAEIKQKVDEWARLDAKAKKAADARNAELNVFLQKHQKAIQPILDHHEPKIQKLVDQRQAIEKEILGWLREYGKPIVLTGELAVAANETSIGARVIDPKKFFDAVKEKTASFWECVNIVIAKAETLIGKKTVNAISTKPSSLKATLKPLPKD
jgi:hypothetical protein